MTTSGSNAAIRAGTRRFVWWDGALWWRTYTEGGYDGYRTAGGRRLPCATLATYTAATKPAEGGVR